MKVIDIDGRKGELKAQINNLGHLYEWSLVMDGKKGQAGNAQGKVFLTDWAQREGLRIKG
jgi:hypothetical protein